MTGVPIMTGAPIIAPAPIIEIVDASKSFDNGQSFAFRNVTLRVETGCFVALVGASGSGKTTLLKIINRLIQPDSGAVRVEGQDVAAINAPVLRRRIGYVFQGVGLFPHMSVAENIGITPKLLGWPAAEIATRVKELLDLVELPQSYLSRPPLSLSGGERQRAGVARAIAARPKIVLMDEPLGALDPITRDSVGSAYRTLHDRLGLTTLMVTHDIQEALLLADRIAVMKAGRILAFDTPHGLTAVAQDPDVAALMGMPKQQAERIRSILDGSGASGRHE